MTDQAGQKNKEEPSGPPPWERKWNDVTQAVGKAIEAAVDTTKKALGGSQMPWERNWGGSSSAPSKPAPKALTGPLNTEADMKTAAMFTPAENIARDVSMRSPENISELKQEIAKAKDPKIKQVLETELAKLQRK
jgi:hypothetical protein